MLSAISVHLGAMVAPEFALSMHIGPGWLLIDQRQKMLELPDKDLPLTSKQLTILLMLLIWCLATRQH